MTYSEAGTPECLSSVALKVSCETEPGTTSGLPRMLPDGLVFSHRVMIPVET